MKSSPSPFSLNQLSYARLLFILWFIRLFLCTPGTSVSIISLLVGHTQSACIVNWKSDTSDWSPNIWGRSRSFPIYLVSVVPSSCEWEDFDRKSKPKSKLQDNSIKKPFLLPSTKRWDQKSGDSWWQRKLMNGTAGIFSSLQEKTKKCFPPGFLLKFKKPALQIDKFFTFSRLFPGSTAQHSSQKNRTVFYILQREPIDFNFGTREKFIYKS